MLPYGEVPVDDHSLPRTALQINATRSFPVFVTNGKQMVILYRQTQIFYL
jgi:hypothetical protein